MFRVCGVTRRSSERCSPRTMGPVSHWCCSRRDDSTRHAHPPASARDSATEACTISRRAGGNGGNRPCAGGKRALWEWRAATKPRGVSGAPHPACSHTQPRAGVWSGKQRGGPERASNAAARDCSWGRRSRNVAAQSRTRWFGHARRAVARRGQSHVPSHPLRGSLVPPCPTKQPTIRRAQAPNSPAPKPWGRLALPRRRAAPLTPPRAPPARAAPAPRPLSRPRAPTWPPRCSPPRAACGSCRGARRCA